MVYTKKVRDVLLEILIQLSVTLCKEELLFFCIFSCTERGYRFGTGAKSTDKFRESCRSSC